MASAEQFPLYSFIFKAKCRGSQRYLPWPPREFSRHWPGAIKIRNAWTKFGNSWGYSWISLAVNVLTQILLKTMLSSPNEWEKWWPRFHSSCKMPSPSFPATSLPCGHILTLREKAVDYTLKSSEYALKRCCRHAAGRPPIWGVHLPFSVPWVRPLTNAEIAMLTPICPKAWGNDAENAL